MSGIGAVELASRRRTRPPAFPRDYDAWARKAGGSLWYNCMHTGTESARFVVLEGFPRRVHDQGDATFDR